MVSESQNPGTAYLVGSDSGFLVRGHPDVGAAVIGRLDWIGESASRLTYVADGKRSLVFHHVGLSPKDCSQYSILIPPGANDWRGIETKAWYMWEETKECEYWEEGSLGASHQKLQLYNKGRAL